MKKYIFILLSFMLFPCIVLAEDCSGIENKTYCKGESCLTSLQSEYNTWNTTGNTGTSCIKVIAQISGTTKSYLNNKDPETNYKCSDGSKASTEMVASAIPNSDEVTDCEDQICYVPEIWKMDCGSSTNTSNSGNSSGTSSSGNTSSGTSNGNSNNISSDSSNNDEISTNDKGQQTGTTDVSDTGVETYFIVLFVMIIVSYGILFFSKKKDLFKSI